MEILAVILILVMIAVAWVTFRILRKTVKFAIRSIIALLIVLVAVIGAALLLNSGAGLFGG